MRTQPLRSFWWPMLTVLYARVSTLDQTVAHQQTQAEAAGFVIDQVVADVGVSGVTVRLRDRPQGRRLLDILRAGDVLVVRWLDRLGRDYEDVRDVLAELMRRRVIVRTVINDMTFDGNTREPMAMALRDAMIGFMAGMAQAQAEANREAQRVGIAHARAAKVGYRGRKPTYDRTQLNTVMTLLDQGAGLTDAAKAAGLRRQAVYRIKLDPAAAEAALARWES